MRDYTLAKKSGGDHGDNHHSGKKTCDRIAEENGVSRASVLRASHYTRGIDIADNLSPGIKQKVFSGEVKFTNEEMSKLVQASVEHRSDVLAQILHPEALEVLESASAEFEPEKAEPVPMPTPQTEEFRCYHVPDEFILFYANIASSSLSVNILDCFSKLLTHSRNASLFTVFNAVSLYTSVITQCSCWIRSTAESCA